LVLTQRLQVLVCASTVRTTLQRLRRRWRRPRLAMPRKTDPEKARKQWASVEAGISAGPEAVVLYGDEARVQTLPLLRAMWQWLGQQIRIPTPGSNTTRAIFGALNIRTGQWSYVVRERLRAADFIAFLESLLAVYPTQTIILIVDNSSSHTAGPVQAWLTEQPRLQLYYLPKYCAHLNPVERIWLRMKDRIAANRLYGSIKVLLNTIASFFTALTPAQALHWAAVEK
jgi:transposase